MLGRLTRTFVRRALYSTQEKKNVVVVPKRHELTFNQFSELEGEICRANSCKVLSVLVKENLELFSDHHIAALFRHIGYYQLPVDDHFHTVIAPIAVEWVKTFGRGQTPALGSILLSLTHSNVTSPELEQLVVRKLDEENFYRYLDLKETVALFVALSKHKRFLSHSLFAKLQKVIYQQKAFYSAHPELVEAIREGMAAVEASTDKPLEIQQAYKHLA